MALQECVDAPAEKMPTIGISPAMQCIAAPHNQVVTDQCKLQSLDLQKQKISDNSSTANNLMRTCRLSNAVCSVTQCGMFMQSSCTGICERYVRNVAQCRGLVSLAQQYIIHFWVASQ